MLILEINAQVEKKCKNVELKLASKQNFPPCQVKQFARKIVSKDTIIFMWYRSKFLFQFYRFLHLAHLRFTPHTQGMLFYKYFCSILINCQDD